MKPALLLLPNLIADHRHHEMFLPHSVEKAVATLDGLIAESEKGGRRYLSRFPTKKPAHEIPLALYNKHTQDKDIDFYLEPIQKQERWGFVSDSGLPCVADPGAKLVKRARELGIAVQAFVGPSSIMLALMQSGLSGQNFSFHGYLDKDTPSLKKNLKILEVESDKKGVTQIFMERPYRNKQTLESLIETLEDKTWLCLACDLTAPGQLVLTQTIEVWKKSPLPSVDKRNALFLFKSA